LLNSRRRLRPRTDPFRRFIRDAIDEKLARADEPDDFERALLAAAGIWASRADIGSTDEYLRKLRQDRRGAVES